MTVTLIAAADPEPEPRPEPPEGPTPGQPTPRPSRPPVTPWWQTRYRIAEHRRGTNPVVPRQRAGWCCDLARYGDVCDCAELAAELRAAFRTPILLDLRRGAA